MTIPQIPGLEGLDLTLSEHVTRFLADGGPMMYPLGVTLGVGLIIVIWKLVEISTKSTRTYKVVRDVDERLGERDIEAALALARESNTPAGRILAAGLARHRESNERIWKATENVSLIEVAALERGLVWLATIANVAPLMGFLGTVLGMITSFEAIELATEMDAQLVAGGIRIALITTASGLGIAIPMNIAHNYFIARVDRLVVDIEESVQKMIEALQEIRLGTQLAGD